jgi:hypothetical protein
MAGSSTGPANQILPLSVSGKIYPDIPLLMNVGFRRKSRKQLILQGLMAHFTSTLFSPVISDPESSIPCKYAGLRRSEGSFHQNTLLFPLFRRIRA